MSKGVRRENLLTITVGQMSRVCCVSRNTVVKWCNAGTLGCNRLPSGKNERRILRNEAILFCRTYGMEYAAEILEAQK